MGMYTELVFGCGLKSDTPNNVITSLKYMLGDIKEKPIDFPFPQGRCEWLFQGCSYYFGVNSPVNKMWYDEISKNWRISTRSNIKNYEGEIEIFLDWIKPYIEQGTGAREMYAMVCYEETEEPTLYYLLTKDNL